MKDENEMDRREDDLRETEPDHSPESADSSSREIVPVDPEPVPLAEPDAALIAHQVTDTVRLPVGTDNAIERHFRHAVIALYAEIGPRDGVESVLARMLVGLNNAVMDCFGRAARNGDWLKARDVNLGHAIKGTSAATELVKALDRHRGQQLRKVAVGQVNVQSGGQAIVGNVGPREERSQGPRPLPIAGPQETDED